MNIPTPYQETFRQNPSRKIGLTLDLVATLNSWSVLKLNHTSTTPRLKQPMSALTVTRRSRVTPRHYHTGSYQPWFG